MFDVQNKKGPERSILDIWVPVEKSGISPYELCVSRTVECKTRPKVLYNQAKVALDSWDLGIPEPPLLSGPYKCMVLVMMSFDIF